MSKVEATKIQRIGIILGYTTLGVMLLTELKLINILPYIAYLPTLLLAALLIIAGGWLEEYREDDREVNQ